MARRRKNLSEKRNEEEKVCAFQLLSLAIACCSHISQMETINKLLKKQAPKTNARRKDFNPTAADTTPDAESQKPNPLFVRWVSNKDGNRIGVPEEWLESPVGAMFHGGVKRSSGAAGMGGKLIQVVS
jgi:Ino eighty subunit 2